MTYLIVYNQEQTEFKEASIHGVITTKTGVADWWHYLPGVYIVSTIKSSKVIADIIKTEFQGLKFLIIKVDRTDFNGILDSKAWTWLAKPANILLKVKPSSTLPTIIKSPLGQILSGLPPIPPKLNGPEKLTMIELLAKLEKLTEELKKSG